MQVEAYPDRQTAAVQAADALERALGRRIAAAGAATLVVSGGTTPADCLRALAARRLDWATVTVLPSDERWVPADHPDSNERMIRQTLLQAAAAAATLQPLYDGKADPEARSRQLDGVIRGLPFPFAAGLLGMGEDGHFASLFPDAAGLDAGLALDSDRLCVAIDTAASPHRRLSLTLAALSRSDELLLLAYGEAKRAVLDEAIRSADRYPLSRLLRQKRAPLRVLWAP